MKFCKKIICIILPLILVITLLSCKKDIEDLISSEGSLNNDSDHPFVNGDTDFESDVGDDAPPQWNMTAKQLYAGKKGVKILGVRNLVNDSRIYLDWAGAGISVALNLNGGKIVFTINGSGNFKVYVDGVPHISSDGTEIFNLSAGPRIVLENISSGEHIVTVVKVDGYDSRAEIPNIIFDGTLLEAPPNPQKYYIEFIGDSHALNQCADGVQDNTLMYPYLTAQKLDADYSLTVLENAALILGDKNIAEEYLYTSRGRASNEKYLFERKADFIVVDLGNDEQSTDKDAVISSYKELLLMLRQKNGSNSKIYCVFDTNNPFAMEISELCSELGGDSAGVYAVDIGVADQNGAVRKITDKIEDTKEQEIEGFIRSGYGTVISWKDGKSQ